MVERAGRGEGKGAIVTGAGSTPGPGIGTGRATAVLPRPQGPTVLPATLPPERADPRRQLIHRAGAVVVSGGRAGLVGMSVAVVASHGRQGIRVSAVAPGPITTPVVLSVCAPGARGEFMNTMRSEAGLLGTPGTGWDVAWAAAFLASDEARWITGVTLPVESGVLSVTPLMMAPYLRAIPDPVE